ncbi:MAG: GDSL-type esterase/lipase family protein [Eubacteriales bacterium]|nr:GDSL-type esterase/lipase family protein [Eubacteriales bacterium]
MNKKHIVCYGDSNTWGYDGETGGRMDDDARWTRLLQEKLGSDYLVMEEGVNGRTTVFEDPLEEGLNGLKALPPALLAHSPIDLLVVMLGTNDCKARFAATPNDIAQGLRRLALKAKGMDVWREIPRLIIIAPMVMGEGLYGMPEVSASMGPGCVEKSRELPELMRRLSLELGCAFLDSNDSVVPNTTDFMHIARENSGALAEKVAEAILLILA